MYAFRVAANDRSETDPRSPLPATKTPRPGLIHPLTSVRFFAALYVAIFHLVRPASLFGPFEDFLSAGYAAVSFFFVLSGFILTYTYAADFEAGRGDTKRFWLARFARIYPVYLLCSLFAAYVYRGEFHPLFHSIAFVADLLMLQSWSIRMSPFFNVPAWSLSVEAFFYAVFPFLLLRVRPRKPAHAIGMIAAMWLLAMVAPAVAVWVDPVGSWKDTFGGGHNLAFAVRRYPILALPEFVAGMVLGWFHLRFRLAKPRAAALLTFGAAGTLLALWYSNHLPLELLHNGLLIPLYSMVILGLCYSSPLATLLSWKPLLLLGEASFALYLFHFAYNDLIQQYFGGPESIASMAWKMLVIVPVSIALHLFVERPGRKFILRYFYGDGQKPATT